MPLRVDIAPDVLAWAAERSGDEPVLASLRDLSTWASAAGGYSDAARNTFLDSGDLYLIAHGHAHGLTVVTHEVPAPDSKKRIKIPDACRGLGVTWTTPYAMLRDAGARFELGA